jgi:hypothetical protein
MSTFSQEQEFKGFTNLIASVYPNEESKEPSSFIYINEDYKPIEESKKDKKRKTKKDWKRELEKSNIEDEECKYCGEVFRTKYANVMHIRRKQCPGFESLMEDTDSSISEEGELVQKYRTRIDIESGVIKSQFPNTTLRDIIYVAGPQGSGKTTYVKRYLEEFKEVFPDKRIILFSRVEGDDAFKEFPDIIEFDITDPDIIDEPLDVKKELTDSLLIFDDYLSLDNKIQKSLNITLKDAIQNGRDHSKSGKDVYVAITSHQITDRNRTRDILTEMSTLTFFPRGGDLFHIEYVLKFYFGLKKDKINEILDLNSRWITISKRMPRYVLWEHGVMNI